MYFCITRSNAMISRGLSNSIALHRPILIRARETRPLEIEHERTSTQRIQKDFTTSPLEDIEEHEHHQ